MVANSIPRCHDPTRDAVDNIEHQFHVPAKSDLIIDERELHLECGIMLIVASYYAFSTVMKFLVDLKADRKPPLSIWGELK